MASSFEAESMYSGIELQYVRPTVMRNFNAVVAPPNPGYQQSVPYGSETITAAGVQLVVSDK
eukprot:6798662-Karenia_brevis.AAC.1